MSDLREACPITGQTASIRDGEFDGWSVDGPYSDGPYRISRSVLEKVRHLDQMSKAKILSWLVDQRRSGQPNPMITSVSIDDAISRRPLRYGQKVDRFFSMLLFHNYPVGVLFRFSGSMDNEYHRNVGRANAWMEVSNPRELSNLLQAMCDEHLLAAVNSQFRLTSNGLRKLDTQSGSGLDSTQAFVAMWFDAQLDEAFLRGFVPAIESIGYRPMRIDKKEHLNKIDDEIIAEIRRSRFLVADFTSEVLTDRERAVAVARGGVYYEAGFAQGLGIPVIWTVRQDCIDHVHFDTRQYAHIVWKDPSDLAAKLSARIGAVIGPPNIS